MTFTKYVLYQRTHLASRLRENYPKRHFALIDRYLTKTFQTTSLFFFFLVPSRAPSVFVTNVTSTSVTIHWNPLPQQYHNGRLLGYRVFLRKAANYPFPVDASNMAVDNSSRVTLNNLEPGQPYNWNVYRWFWIMIQIKEHQVFFFSLIVELTFWDIYSLGNVTLWIKESYLVGFP